MKEQKNCKLSSKIYNRGITLIALIITIIVLMILAGVSISALTGENGVITRAQRANEEYKVGEARERLTLTLGNAQAEKKLNKEYNQDDFLDDFIKKEIDDVEIKEDVAIVNDYAFNIDRSVPKIGEYIGKKDELIFPTVNLTKTIANNNVTATITINAEEATNGISKIEVILGGFVIQEYTYDNIKDPITLDYTAKYNGKYKIKVYSKLANADYITIDELVSAVEYSPNGDTEYKKEHSVTVSSSEDLEKVKSIKYQWLNTTVEPSADTFTESCNNGETLTKDGLTGTYYLWTLLETASGKTSIGRSELFNFDNTGPSVSLTSTAVSATSFTLNATASDALTGISKYEFYVNSELKNAQETTAGSASYTATGVSTGSTSCYVIVYDTLGNSTKQTVTASTKLYTWAKYNTKKIYVLSSTTRTLGYKQGTYAYLYSSYTFNNDTGVISASGTCTYLSLYETATGVKNAQGRYYIINSRCMIYFSSYSSHKWPCTYWTVRDYSVDTNGVYTKGTTQYSNVTSTSSSTYPSNGKSGNYWYVYKGVY